MQHGSVLLAIRASDEQAHQVANILDSNGAINIDERTEKYHQKGFLPSPATPLTPTVAKTEIATVPAPPTTNAAGEQVLNVVEENLAVGKCEVQSGGTTIAQDQATSQAFYMPRAAINTGCANFVLPIERIAPALIALAMIPGATAFFTLPASARYPLLA